MFTHSANCPSTDHKIDAAKSTVRETRVVLGKTCLEMVARMHRALTNFDDHYLMLSYNFRWFKEEIECFEGCEPNRRNN